MGNQLVPGQAPRSHEHIQYIQQLTNIRIIGDNPATAPANAIAGGAGAVFSAGVGLGINKHFKQGRVLKTGVLLRVLISPNDSLQTISTWLATVRLGINCTKHLIPFPPTSASQSLVSTKKARLQ